MHEDEKCPTCGQMQMSMNEEEYEQDGVEENHVDEMGEKSEVLDSLLKALNGEQTAGRIEVLITNKKKKNKDLGDNPEHNKKKNKGGY